MLSQRSLSIRFLTLCLVLADLSHGHGHRHPESNTGENNSEIGEQSDVENYRASRFVVFANARVDSVPCNGTTGKGLGICKTVKSCKLAKGTDVGLGTCTNGYGTCCLITLKGAPLAKDVTTVTERVVTLKASGVANSRSIFEFPKQSDICQLKLDFLDTQLENPSSDPVGAGNCRKDAISLSGSSTLPPEGLTVCGDLMGQHMYLTYGTGGVTPSDKITIDVKTISKDAKYSISVVQIKCGSPDIVKEDCLQQFTGNTGQVRSFGFPSQLNNQYYRICTKGENLGAKSVTWAECPTRLNKKQFFITGFEEPPGSPVASEQGNILCSSDYVDFPSQPSETRYCGGSFTKMTVPNGNGVIDVHLDQNEIGHSVVIRNLPPSLSCSAINFPVHDCRVHGVGTEPCICTLNKVFPIQIRIPVLMTETCPTVTGYQCSKTTPLSCGCVQLYDEADQANTGFCLQFTHNY